MKRIKDAFNTLVKTIGLWFNILRRFNGLAGLIETLEVRTQMIEDALGQTVDEEQIAYRNLDILLRIAKGNQMEIDRLKKMLDVRASAEGGIVYHSRRLDYWEEVRQNMAGKDWVEYNWRVMCNLLGVDPGFSPSNFDDPTEKRSRVLATLAKAGSDVDKIKVWIDNFENEWDKIVFRGLGYMADDDEGEAILDNITGVNGRLLDVQEYVERLKGAFDIRETPEKLLVPFTVVKISKRLDEWKEDLTRVIGSIQLDIEEIKDGVHLGFDVGSERGDQAVVLKATKENLNEQGLNLDRAVVLSKALIQEVRNKIIGEENDPEA